MTPSHPPTGLALRSLVKSSGELELALTRVPIPEPAADEVVMCVEATPINPSDVGWLLANGMAELAAARPSGTADEPVVTIPLRANGMAALASRLDIPVLVGNEGAGKVVRAGASPAAQALLGKTVAALSRGMYAQYNCVKASLCQVMPDGVSAVEGASSAANPLTALCLFDVMKRDGHTAVIQTAAASHLGRMVLRVGLADGIDVVHIVRKPADVALLCDMGARYVVDSTSPTFTQDLTRHALETNATAVFDPIGGGTLGNTVLACIEAAQASKLSGPQRYGSPIYKHLYIYGNLDPSPTVLDRTNLGTSWGTSVFLLMRYLEHIGPDAAAVLQRRVLAELKTTFASRYARSISLRDLLRPEEMLRYSRLTGGKVVVTPNG